MDNILAHRVTTMANSATLAMANKIRILRAEGHDMVDLASGEPGFLTPTTIQEAAKKAIDEKKYFSYSPVAGYMDLREAIATKLKRDNHIVCTPQQIVISSGAKQSLANLFLCLLDPGDEIIVYTPYWVSYPTVITLTGGKPIFISGRLEDGFIPTKEVLTRAITKKTKAILFSNPCNPSGVTFSPEVLQDIATVVEKNPKIIAIVDEIYEYLSFTPHTSLGAFSSIQDRVVTVNGFSKGFAMTGWRIGYLTAPLWLAKACEKIQGQLTSGPCSIAQRGALAALTITQEATIMATKYKKRRDLMLQMLAEIPGFTYYTPTGAFFIFPDISYYFGTTDGEKYIHNAIDFCDYLVEKAHVCVVVGNAFGAPNHIRISYAAKEEVLQEGIQRIKEAIGKLHKPTTH